METTGKEKLRKPEHSIIVCNHQSALDTMAMCANWIPRTVVLGKKELFYVPLFGQYFYFGGHVFIDRKNREKALDAMARTSERIKKDKLNVWVFPEGTRNLHNGFLPFKKGAFHLAVKAQIPITPMVVAPQNFLRPSETTWDSGVMRVSILDPIETTGKTSDDVTGACARARARARAHLSLEQLLAALDLREPHQPLVVLVVAGEVFAKARVLLEGGGLIEQLLLLAVLLLLLLLLLLLRHC